MKQMKRVAIALALSAQLATVLISSAFAFGPAAGTTVAWTNDTYFDSYSTQSGLTSSDKSSASFLIWQVYYAHAPLTIPADGVSRIGINTYANGVNSIRTRISVSTVDETFGSFGTDYEIASVVNASYTAGGLYQYPVTTAVTIPANRYFMIGITGGPAYRTFKALASSRTAQVAGENYVTAMNSVYWSTTAATGIPSALGGSSGAFTTYDGFAPVISVKFKATGTPPLFLTPRTPDTPTVTSVDGSYVVISNPSVVPNAQSYFASLYDASGTTLIESRTVSNSQVTNGFTWTGLSTQTSYQIRLTAVGDGVSYSNSLPSGLRSFTTTLNTTSVNLNFSSTTATYNSPITITATLGGSTQGKITFYSNGKRIPKCVSKPVTSTSATCIWKPSTRGASIVSAIFTPVGATYLSSSTLRSILISNRLVNRP